MPAPPTALSTLADRLRACAESPANTAPPAAVLWPDPSGEFAPAVPALREELPGLLTLGDYDPEARTGPAIWLRCEIDSESRERPPVVYLPGVGREQLAAGEATPEPLLPLVELLYRGTRWKQSGGQDWTLRAFLIAKEGAGLNVAGDAATAASLRNAAAAVLAEPLQHLRGKRLDAAALDRLLTGDEVRTVLDWLNDASVLDAMPPEQRAAFASRAREALGLEVEVDGRLGAAEKLAAGEGPWAEVWERFAENPTRWAGVHAALLPVRRAGLFAGGGHYPAEDADAEETLAAALKAAAELPAAEARGRVAALEAEHGLRRAGAWAQLGQAHWAETLEPLAELAAGTSAPAPGGDREAMAAAYVGGGWRADWAALAALGHPAARASARRPTVEALVDRLLGPWQDEAAERFQGFAEAPPTPPEPLEAEPGGCVLFVDALRLDLGLRLAEALEALGGFAVERGCRWAALPTVTATGKPAASPAAAEVAAASAGATLGPDFLPLVGGKPCEATALRTAIAGRGYAVFAADDPPPPPPRSPEDRGWTETKRIDDGGHGGTLAASLGPLMEEVGERVASILEAGWSSVRVVTDHGWLFRPGGLPRADLPKHATQSRWARCAVPQAGADPAVPTAPWAWDPTKRFAFAPGTACFNKTERYAHGGLSLQECLLPDLVVRRTHAEETSMAEIEDIGWRGLRCDVKTSGAPEGSQVRVAGVSKPVKPDGVASLLIPDEDLAGEEARVELLDAGGDVLARRETVVGG